MSALRSSATSRLVALDAGGAASALAPREAARLVSAALAAEPGALLLRPSPAARAIFAELDPRTPVVAVLPDVAGLLREAADRGAARAALARLGRARPRAWWRLALAAVRHLPEIARQDFRGLVPVLIELERAGLSAADLQGIALGAPLTDLLLAAGHDACFAHVVQFVRHSIGVHAGFETLNLGHLLARLAAWRVEPDFVIGPLNASGFRMKPSPAAVLDAVRRAPFRVLASEVTAGGSASLASALAHARAHGAAGTVTTLDELASDSDCTPTNSALTASSSRE